MPRRQRPQRGFDDDDLAEAIERVERADHDEDAPELKRARESAREAEREWD